MKKFTAYELIDLQLSKIAPLIEDYKRVIRHYNEMGIDVYEEGEKRS
jgi:hypothetical protein